MSASSKKSGPRAKRGRPRSERAAWSPSRVYDLMDEAGSNVHALAAAAEVSASTVYKWQATRVRASAPTVEQAEAIAEMLGEALGRKVRLRDLAPKPQSKKEG